MSYFDDVPRRSFLRACAITVAGLVAGSSVVHRLEALNRFPGPEDPEVPNEEDGRVVPVMIETDLPMTADNYVKAVHLIVDHNPDPLLAAFHLTPALGAVSLSTRIKMKRTTWVRAVAQTSTGELWADYSRVRVTLNGCG
jgi:hypothetical protein